MMSAICVFVIMGLGWYLDRLKLVSDRLEMARVAHQLLIEVERLRALTVDEQDYLGSLYN